MEILDFTPTSSTPITSKTIAPTTTSPPPPTASPSIDLLSRESQTIAVPTTTDNSTVPETPEAPSVIDPSLEETVLSALQYSSIEEEESSMAVDVLPPEVEDSTTTEPAKKSKKKTTKDSGRKGKKINDEPEPDTKLYASPFSLIVLVLDLCISAIYPVK